MTALVGLMIIELPTRTLRLCDGGFFVWGGNTFLSEDATFGTVQSIDALTEGTGDEIPALQVTFIPASTAAAGDLSQPGFQRSRVRLYIGKFNPVTGQIIGTPELHFDGQIDRTKLTSGRGTRTLEMDIVSSAERLFMRNEGNSLNPTWHKSIWPGELGHDNATNLTIPVAWGTDAPPVLNGPASNFYGAGGAYDGILPMQF